MFVSFNIIADTARVWVYQANRNLTDDEVGLIEQYLHKNIETWLTHGANLVSSVTVIAHRFVVVATDETHHAASGCSIDTSVQWIRALGQQLEVDFLDRSLVFRADTALKSIPIMHIKRAVQDQELRPDTMVFDTVSVKTKADLALFEKPASDTWLGRYF